MSRKQHTILIVQVRIPVPAGKTQEATLAWMKEALVNYDPATADMHSTSPFGSNATQVKITGRETTYL